MINACMPPVHDNVKSVLSKRHEN